MIAEARRLDRPLALDSQALIMYLENRPLYAALLAPVVEDDDVPIVISSITLAEVLVLPAKHGDITGFDALRRIVLALPALEIRALDITVAIETALVRGQFGFHLPDAAIVATARIARAVGLIGNDRRWRPKPLGVPYHHLDDIVAMSE